MNKMIDRLIKENRCFAFYRLPQQHQVHFLSQNNRSPDIIRNLNDINKQNAFIIAPFYISQDHPVVLIRPDNEKTFVIPVTPFRNVHSNIRPSYPTDDYRKRFSIFHKSVNEDHFEKLVLSRQIEIPIEPFFSAGKSFYLAYQTYIYSCVYLFHTPQTGTWLGCSPEILLSNRINTWQTVALAGTQPISQENQPFVWDEKNKHEQQMVADYIRRLLHSYHIEPVEKGPYPVRAGKLMHLKSDFYFSLSGNQQLGNFLHDLHPTPATCGIPQPEARQFLMENEGYERSYYTGFAGRLQPRGITDLYVNLRCMKIEERYLKLFAGGGILPSSEPVAEWMETENKLQTMLFLTKANVYG